MADPTPACPSFVTDLEAVYGPESDAGFGGAVFWRPAPAGELEAAAREIYRSFVGKSWERFGADAWLGPWRRVHARAEGAARDLASELAALEDAEARRAVPLLLEVGDPDAAKAALHAAFDDEAVSRLEVYNIGDGGAMSGLLVAALRDGHLLVVVALLD